MLELVDGPSLARHLDGGPLSPARALDVIEQAATGLAAAHRAGLLHRDIKPGNLLLSQDGLIKITDFGIARAAGSVVHTRTGALTGTPAYLAPERFGGAPATPATDLYALGVVAYQCLTGQLPFTGDPLVVALAHVERDMPPLPGSVPADLAALVADLTRKDPRARPASAIAVLARAGLIREAVSGPPASSASAGTATPAGTTTPAGSGFAGTSAADGSEAGHTAAAHSPAGPGTDGDTAAWDAPGWDAAAGNSPNPADLAGTSTAGANHTATSPAETSHTPTSLTGASHTGTSASSPTKTSFAGTSAAAGLGAAPFSSQRAWCRRAWCRGRPWCRRRARCRRRRSALAWRTGPTPASPTHAHTVLPDAGRPGHGWAGRRRHLAAGQRPRRRSGRAQLTQPGPGRPAGQPPALAGYAPGRRDPARPPGPARSSGRGPRRSRSPTAPRERARTHPAHTNRHFVHAQHRTHADRARRFAHPQRTGRDPQRDRQRQRRRTVGRAGAG